MSGERGKHSNLRRKRKWCREVSIKFFRFTTKLPSKIKMNDPFHFLSLFIIVFSQLYDRCLVNNNSQYDEVPVNQNPTLLQILVVSFSSVIAFHKLSITHICQVFVVPYI